MYLTTAFCGLTTVGKQAGATFAMFGRSNPFSIWSKAISDSVTINFHSSIITSPLYRGCSIFLKITVLSYFSSIKSSNGILPNNLGIGCP